MLLKITGLLYRLPDHHSSLVDEYPEKIVYIYQLQTYLQNHLMMVKPLSSCGMLGYLIEQSHNLELLETRNYPTCHNIPGLIPVCYAMSDLSCS